MDGWIIAGGKKQALEITVTIALVKQHILELHGYI